MSLTVKTNFGSINGRRIVTFKVSYDGMCIPVSGGKPISGLESFKRWKIARKAWRTRKSKQLTLPL